MAIRCMPAMLANANTSAAMVAPKAADSLYQTASFKAWALSVKKRAGFKCELCPRVDGRMFADHIVEVKDGGAEFDLANGQCLCGSCHTRKTMVERARRARA